jgi:hypothetical protein
MILTKPAVRGIAAGIIVALTSDTLWPITYLMSGTMVADLGALPPELLASILAFAVRAHPRPASVLAVSRAWALLGARALHAHLVFGGARALGAFAAGDAPLAVTPRTLTLAGAGDDGVFDRLCGALVRCRRVRAEDGAVLDGAGPVELDELALCLHSHAQSTRLHIIRDVLALVKFVFRAFACIRALTPSAARRVSAGRGLIPTITSRPQCVALFPSGRIAIPASVSLHGGIRASLAPANLPTHAPFHHTHLPASVHFSRPR